MEKKQNEKERAKLERDYQQKVHTGEFPQHETLLPLFPYQREGMLHLAFKERAMVADEMGLGKTVQGIAAASLLHRLGKAERCLIVAPASLKAEWEEEQLKAATVLVGAGLHAMAPEHLGAAALASAAAGAVRNFTTPTTEIEQLEGDPRRSFLPQEAPPLLEQIDELTESQCAALIDALAATA